MPATWSASSGANSTEFDPYAPHKVIDLMPEQLEAADLGGTMRLGDWPMDLAAGTSSPQLYGVPQGGTVRERHRHRFEVNPAYVERLKARACQISGVTPGVAGRGAGLVESIETPGHPFFVALAGPPRIQDPPDAPQPALCRLHRGGASAKKWSVAPQAVRISGAFSVIMTVCSKCAASPPSRVQMVQPSRLVFVRQARPVDSIGSMASTSPRCRGLFMAG